MSIDYALYYRREIDVDAIDVGLPRFDLFISSFNSSDRVKRVFEKVRSSRKVWLVHPEYRYSDADLPVNAEIVAPPSISEMDQVNDLMASIGELPKGAVIGIDITGFMRHVLVFLVAKLHNMGVSKFTALYTEPSAYSKQEETEFSTTTTGRVRTISGLGGSMDYGKDAVIVGVGYDHKLIGEVMNARKGAVMKPLFSFPSLSPDMYQQSAIRASRSGDKAFDDDWMTNKKFAPANDPFVTAAVVSDIIRNLDSLERHNVYLAPLATKVQALGFVIYWILEGRKRGACAMLLPECESYARETSVGTKRVWSFTVEMV